MNTLRPALRALMCIGGLLLAAAGSMADDAGRRAWLDWMQQNLPENPPWTEWQARTGALPPDFETLPRRNLLPDPLRFLDGRPVITDSDWQQRRAEIRRLFEQYVLGRFPPKPRIDRVVTLEETRSEGFVTRNVRLEFGPEGKGSVRVQLTIPDGAGPRPVLMHPSLGDSWAAMTIRRGYASVGYAGNDAADDGANLVELYPDHDFAALPRRAWLAGIVLDYLESVPELDMRRVALFGYSRDGKMATIAAAFDERIAALIAGSTGVGGLLPYRIAGERGNGEGIETTTRMFPTWFAPQLRFFSGREDRLPVDANLLLALIAPRAVLMEYGTNDEVSNVWGMEQVYHSALPLFEKAGAASRLGLLRAPGFHDGIGRGYPGAIQESCLDWLDIQFGRSDREWRNEFAYPWDFEAWRKRSGETAASAGFKRPEPGATFAERAPEIRRAVEWMLGERPTMIPTTGPVAAKYRGFRFPPPPGPVEVAAKSLGSPGQFSPDVAAWVISRGGQEFGWLEPEKNAVESRRVRFGQNVVGDLYLPAGTPADKRLPTVIWLHGYSYPLGYMWVYRRDLHPILALVKAGFAVFAYDQTGFGSRWHEAATFYDRCPRWSQMGRMVEDVGQAIDALAGEGVVDSDRISILGYTLGGTVALHAAALDPRVRSVVSVAGFTPLRTDSPERGTSGMMRYSHQRGLLPRLGLFAGDPAAMPYDFDDLLGLVAPRATLVVQPALDRDAHPADVRAAVERARAAFGESGAADKLVLFELDDYARLPTATQDRIVEWLLANP